MPVVGQHSKPADPIHFPTRIAKVAVLTYERPGYLTQTVKALREASPGLPVAVYDDGSQLAEKLVELADLDAAGVKVVSMPHEGFLESWRKIFCELHGELGDSEDGVVLLEDDVVVAEGWDRTILSMAAGTAAMGLRPGAMTCLRCHKFPQAELVDLNGVLAYQSMAHGFQLNMVPAWVLGRMDVVDKAMALSKAGKHGFDIWFLGMLSGVLGLTNFISMNSWAAHIGTGNSVVEKQGYKSFSGYGYELVPSLVRKIVELQSIGMCQ